jgi:hypothetical protein
LFFFENLMELFVASKAIKNNIPLLKGWLQSGHGHEIKWTVVISEQ